MELPIVKCATSSTKPFIRYTRIQPKQTRINSNRIVVKNFKNYSVLAHVDFIRRYDKSYYSLEHTYPIVSEILKQAIKDGKGIEINTSSFQYKIPDLTPSVDIIKLYKELGGEIITIGSDSHTLNRLGNNILDIHQKLRELGFDSFYTFDKMTPIRHELSVLAELA